jgi:hypothetical protein
MLIGAIRFAITRYKLMPSTVRMPRKLKSRLRRWRRHLRRARQKLARAPRAIRIAVIAATLLVAFTLSNLLYQVIHKPTELFFFVGHRLDKEPPETWRQYGALFRTYSTAMITPELLAALAQQESSGNPVDRTYWRWRFSFNPFAIYRPASSAVGLFQMTDPAFAEAAPYCIRDHAVTDTGCGFGPYVRAFPRHSIELASVYLERNVSAVLDRTEVNASPQQKQDLAAFIHLCGPGPATAFAHRKFQMIASERCGDHSVAAYVARVNALKRQFQRLVADDAN